MGRRKGKNNIQISVSIPTDLIEKIEQYAISKRLPRSKVITMAIEYFLSTSTEAPLQTKSVQNIPKEIHIPPQNHSEKKVYHSPPSGRRH